MSSPPSTLRSSALSSLRLSLRSLRLCVEIALSSAALAQPGYADPNACAVCHAQIAETYARTGMARSFGAIAPGAALPPIAGGTFRHDASEQNFSLPVRDGKTYLRREQDGSVLEKEVSYWIGSGNHARSYLSRTASGELLELPATWYAEAGGRWGMSPGYSRPDHAGFSRKINYACMFCHNAYPDIARGPPRHLSRTPAAGHRLPALPRSGTGPHPGRESRRIARRSAPRHREPGASRPRPPHRSLPAVPSRNHQPAPSRLAHALRPDCLFLPPRRASGAIRPAFRSRPGRGFDDKFEFSSSPYRLRKSACFLASAGKLTCTTCHNPHDVPARRSRRRAIFAGLPRLSCWRAFQTPSRGRRVHLLPHAQTPPVGRRPGDRDRPLHPQASRVRSRGGARRTQRRQHSAVSRHRAALLSPGSCAHRR